MYMDSSSWDIENRRSFEPTAMTMPSTPTSGHPNSLPPLHQVAYPPPTLPNVHPAYLERCGNKAIPEFHSHNPQERRSSSVPRKLVERGSPSFRAPHRVSPSSSSAISDTGSMATFPSLESGVSAPGCLYPVLFLTGGMTVATTNEHMEGPYDAQMCMFPGQLDSKRLAGISSSAAMDSRPSPSYLPPVSSLTSSRGSSFDMEHSERPQGIPAPLPLLYNSHHHQQGHSTYNAQYEHDIVRSQQTTPDYHRYPSSSAMSPSPYQSSSPINQYSQPQYYSHSGAYAQQPRPQSAYVGRQPIADARSPFSTPNHPVDLNSMDHFEQGRPGKRRRGNLPKQVTDLLRSWLNDHTHHPYPTEDEKQMLMAQTGLTIHQISNWFINARRRRLPAITNPDPKTSSSRRPSSGS